MGTTGDSYDNVMAETIIALFNTEVIHARGPWRSLDAVEYATLEWVDWSTIAASSSPSVMCHQRSSKRSTTVSNPVWPSRPDLNPELSKEAGAIQIEPPLPLLNH